MTPCKHLYGEGKFVPIMEGTLEALLQECGACGHILGKARIAARSGGPATPWIAFMATLEADAEWQALRALEAVAPMPFETPSTDIRYQLVDETTHVPLEGELSRGLARDRLGEITKISVQAVRVGGRWYPLALVRSDEDAMARAEDARTVRIRLVYSEAPPC